MPTTVVVDRILRLREARESLASINPRRSTGKPRRRSKIVRAERLDGMEKGMVRKMWAKYSWLQDTVELFPQMNPGYLARLVGVADSQEAVLHASWREYARDPNNFQGAPYGLDWVSSFQAWHALPETQALIETLMQEAHGII